MQDKDLKALSAVANNLGAIRTKIFAAEQAYKMQSGTERPVTLVAVSKRQPDDRIDAALVAGQRVFGENRVQEASGRWAHRRDFYADLKLHLIGPLQTNKVSDAVTLFDIIEVVDRPKLAKALSAEMICQNRQLECYIQVNTGEEEQKSGIAPDDADDFIVYCRDEAKLKITGLMCIPPVDEEASMHFALLKTIAERNNIYTLSMGMSDDFEEAITFGANSIRVGSAIFGQREG
ncbi:YggS family pyridoxal phosphate-dependent enzyme [Candidatus Puniceispirillum sp.]|nr:YggS family pyridoxal phosphate-dependent enzyme [Candidatus Puniceispirillum sp.]